MSDRSYEVDKYGTYYSRENRSRSPSSYSDRSDASYRSRSGSRSHNYKYRQRSYSRSRSRSSSRPRSSRRDWIVPTNPLLRGDDSHHHHHRHHHHHHHHHRHRSHSPKRLTVADKKERWGHELYIENVCVCIVFLPLGSPQSGARTSPTGGRMAASPRKVDLEGRRRCKRIGAHDLDELLGFFLQSGCLQLFCIFGCLFGEDDMPHAHHSKAVSSTHSSMGVSRPSISDCAMPGMPMR